MPGDGTMHICQLLSNHCSAMRTVPLSQIVTVSNAVRPVVETITDEGKATRDAYEHVSADEKVRVAKRTPA